MSRLAGKVAIITGGARGIGEAIARCFAAEGAKVAIIDILEEEGKSVADACGASAAFHSLDVSDEAGWARVVADVTADHGVPDILVNNAAQFFYAMIEDTQSSMLRRLTDVNLIGPSLGMSAVIPGMKRHGQGSIINISSTDGMQGAAGMSSYNASKWGLRGLSRSVALEVGPWNIRVNTIHPGTIDTAMLNPEGVSASALECAHPTIPLIRIGRPAEVAKAALYLAGEESSYVSGAELLVDGGYIAGHYYAGRPVAEKDDGSN